MSADAVGSPRWAGVYACGMANTDTPTVVVQIGTEHYTSQISAKAHSLVADEPSSVGGADAGPDPYDLLLASLGACKAITMRMYADRKEWPLESAQVGLRHERVHAKDCEDCETKQGQVDRIHVEIYLTGDLTDEQRERIVEISERCPVHKTLMSETKIVTTSA
jgi:putative redox protein